ILAGVHSGAGTFARHARARVAAKIISVASRAAVAAGARGGAIGGEGAVGEGQAFGGVNRAAAGGAAGTAGGAVSGVPGRAAAVGHDEDHDVAATIERDVVTGGVHHRVGGDQNGTGEREVGAVNREAHQAAAGHGAAKAVLRAVRNHGRRHDDSEGGDGTGDG